MALTQERYASIGDTSQCIVGADLASGTTVTPTAKIHKVTGSSAISNITLPWAGFQGTIVFIPTGAWSLATGGSAYTAIGLAATAVTGKAMFLTYVDNLWYPSYTA